MERDTLIADEKKALNFIKDGMTVALGGLLTAHHPMALIRGMAKKKLKNLTIIGGLSSALDVDLLISYGCVRRLVTAYVGAESASPIGPFYKKAAEDNEIEIWECDEIILAAILKATASGVPFFPVRGGLGTDLPKLNPHLKEFKDPVNNEPLLAVPAMQIDVALTHASKSDRYGNVQYDGNCYVDNLINFAADFTITTVEKIVFPEEIRRDPFKTAYTANMIVKAPFGSHPYSCHGSYLEDEEYMLQYATAAYMATKGDNANWNDFRKRYIDSPKDHIEYLEQVGLRKLFSLNEA